MNKSIKKQIEKMISNCNRSVSGSEAMHYSQAALNLINGLSVLSLNEIDVDDN